MNKATSKKSSPKVAEVTLVPESNESDGLTMARAALSPSLNAAIAAHSYQKNLLGDDVTLMDLTDALLMQSKKVQDGDLSGMEAMLVGQATALQTIFTSLARRAQVQTQQRNLEAFLGLALKAQSQSRATIATLVELKYPRQVAFVKQANISHGHQQINNGSRTQEIQSEKSKLIVGYQDGSKTMDTGTTQAAVGGYTALETMETIHRTNEQ